MIGTRRIISFVPIFQSSILFTSILSRNIALWWIAMSYNQILLIRFFEMENLLLKTIIRYNHEFFIYTYLLESFNKICISFCFVFTPK